VRGKAGLATHPLKRWFPNGEWILLLALLAESALFSAIARNFFTWENFFEVVRASIEVGLLALALTPVMVSGGIDLSVGSMMGLAAVTFGATWQTGHASPILAAVLALIVGCAGGALNAVLVARFRIPALIVTLGSYSLFRGIAEGVTHGAVNYSGFPGSWLSLGQGYLWGVVPAQLPRHGRALRRHSRGETDRAGVPALRIGFEYRCDRVRGAPGAGEVGCGDWLRT
jgi:rhamnose transport system substrate-binding protein/rhamnose transport system permease protein